MSTTPPAQNRTFLRRWKDFWFSPADPTALGFMRVVTGLLVLYTHMTYSLDLQPFFGKDGWYGASYIERAKSRTVEESHRGLEFMPSSAFWSIKTSRTELT